MYLTMGITTLLTKSSVIKIREMQHIKYSQLDWNTIIIY